MGKKKVAKVRRLVKYRRVNQRQKAKKPVRTTNAKNAKVNARQVLHSLWFSKKNDSPRERGRKTEIDLRSLAKEMDFYERQVERSLQEAEKNTENRIEDLKKRTEEMSAAFQKSVDAVNSSVAALRRENEELKKDRQVLSDKIKNMMTEREEFGLVEPVASGNVEKIISEPESSFADHHSEKKIETSMDSLLD